MNKFMTVAIEEAYKGIKKGDGGPFGAVVVRNNKIVGKGHNCVLKNNDATCHAEMMAIRDACKNLKSFSLRGCDIYITAFPCIMCIGGMLWSNIRNIYYGCSLKENNDIGFRDQVFVKNLNLCIKKVNKPFIQMDHKECRKLFDDYLKIKDRKIY